MVRFFFSLLAGFAILILLSTVHTQCETKHSQIEVQEVRFVTPDTYFLSEVHVKYKNIGDEPIKSADFNVAYRSPNADTTYWTRVITCSHTGDGLQPDKSYYSRCNWNGEVPPVRDSKDKQPNAALFFTGTSVDES